VNDKSHEASVVEELWELYDKLLTWRDLGSRQNLLARVRTALSEHQIPDHQAAVVLKVLINEAVSLAANNAEKKGDGLSKSYARECDAARRLIGVVEKPGSTKEIRRKNAAVAVAPDSDSTIRRRCTDRTYFKSLLSVIDQVCNDLTARRSFIRKAGLKRVADPKVNATLQESSGAAMDQYSDEHSHITELLELSAVLRRKLDPQKVTRALIRTGLVDDVLAAAGIISATPDSPPRILAIRGDAGSGKTVITGQVYDALVNDAEAAVLVIPCEMLLETPRTVDDFDTVFGQLIKAETGLVLASRSLVSVQSQPVVVLFDTIDYLLNTASRAGFIALLEHLHDVGATVVFSCRRHDYNLIFQPEGMRFGKLSLHVLPPVDVRPLVDDEVVEITKSYLEYRDLPLPISADQFAGDVLNLAADHLPLKTIITNPLLLIMVCETFAHTGIVPKDLTTTQLCKAYREQKINKSRKYPGDADFEAKKLRLWQKIAGEMWRLSEEHIALSVPEIGIIEDVQLREAYQDLRSEDVLIAGLDSLRVRFHHQVLAEYSIAMYLRDSAPAELESLLNSLRIEPNRRWFGWQIVRHLMAAAEDKSEAERLLGKLDLSQAPAFRAAAFGLAEQWHEGLLEHLADSDVFLDDLLEALLCVVDKAIGEAFNTLAKVMKKGESSQINAAAVAAGFLVVRAPAHLQDHLVPVLETIRALQTGELKAPGVIQGYPDWILKSLLDPVLTRQIILGKVVLATLRELVTHASPIGIRSVIRAHLIPGVPKHEQRDLLTKVLSHKQANKTDQEGLDLIALVVDWRMASPDAQIQGDDPVIFLVDGEKNSEVLRAKAVARAINERTELRTVVVRNFLDTANSGASYRLLRCLQESVKYGGAGWLSDVLVTLAVPDSATSIGQVCALMKMFAEEGPELRYSLAGWFAPYVTVDRWKTVDAYAGLVYDDSIRFQLVLDYLVALDDGQQKQVIDNLAHKVGSTQVDRLNQTIAELRVEASPSVSVRQVRLAANAAETDNNARHELLDLVDARSSKVSLQALHHIQKAAYSGHEWLSPEMLNRFSDHRYTSSRVGALKALIIMVRNQGKSDSPAVRMWLSTANMRLINNTITLAERLALLELSHAYIRNGIGKSTDTLAEIIFFVKDTVSAISTTEVRYGRALLALVKTGAMHPDREFGELITGHGLTALEKIDISFVKDGRSFMQEMLVKMLDYEYLRLDALLNRAQNWTAANLTVLVDVVISRDAARENSLLLDEILTWDIDASVHQAVWKHRLQDSQK
jgi:hypothetical protein